ncbi:hypothetical protein RB195_023518 [Necator americanus]|uniref:Reverse transcriptase domain-containing protein n=1 Tax=Necator americanus TaxID=51031 RepID=A0ABR1ELU9_NECAM
MGEMAIAIWHALRQRMPERLKSKVAIQEAVIRLELMEMKMKQGTISVTRFDHICSADIQQRLGVFPIAEKMGQYYRQLRGLAMGQRLAPTLAIVFMAKIEKPIIDSKPLLHYRYIDDCCVVCSTQAELDACFNILNQQCNMYRTAARVSSSSQEKAWSINVAHKVAMSNGYPTGDGATRQARKRSDDNQIQRMTHRLALTSFADFGNLTDHQTTQLRVKEVTRDLMGQHVSDKYI